LRDSSHNTWIPLIVVVGLISISLLLLYLLAREILIQLLEQLKGIVKLCGHFFAEISKFLFQPASILWIIWGLFFALRWRTQSAIVMPNSWKSAALTYCG
jgi:hypothetical protein